MLNHLNICKEIYNLTEPSFIQFRPSEIFRKNVFETFIFLFNASHCIIDHTTNLWSVCSSRNYFPTGIFRHKKDIFRNILVNIFLKAVAFFNQFLIFSLKAIRNIFKED